jgi:hypothetical protein
MKYNNLMKNSYDTKRTSSGLPTYRQVQSDMPFYLEGGVHKYIKSINFHI